MSRSYFEEVQMLRDNRWIWMLIIAFSLLALLPLMDGLYLQLIRGKPWGDKPMSDQGLIFMFAFVVICLSILVWMLLSLKLETKIDEQGIHVRLFPFKPKWQLITSDDVIDYSFEKRFRFLDSGGIGYHRNCLKRQRSFRIGGGNHLSMKLKNGETLLLGTQDLLGIEWALKKLMLKNEMI